MFDRINMAGIRDNLEIIPYIAEEGRFRYYVKDPDCGEIYEFGEGEYFLIEQLKNCEDSVSICREFTSTFGETINPSQVEAFVRKLDNMGLLANEKADLHARQIEKDEAATKLLFNPDRFFGIFHSLCSPMIPKILYLLLPLLALFSIASLLRYFSDYFYQLRVLRQIYGLNLIFIGPVIGFLVVYPLAEFAKGLACKYYGGQVPALRLAYMFRLIPLFHVDIVDALWIMNRRKRLRVFAAGPLMQLLVFSGMVLFWMAAEPWSPVHNFACFISFICFLFLFFNINPLFTRDGYFMLATGLNVDELKSRSEQYAKDLFFLRPVSEPLTEKERRWFWWYGLLRLMFKNILTFLILAFFGTLLVQNLQGLGAMAFLIILFLRFEESIKKTVQGFFHPFSRVVANETGFVKTGLLIKLGFLFLAVIVLFLPYPFEVGGTFVVKPLNQLSIRAEVAGSIESVLVKENDRVFKGQPVAKLDDRLPKKKVESLTAALEEQQALLSLRRKGTRPEEVAMAEQETQAAAKQLEYSEQEAKRYKNMFERNAVPESEYLYALRVRDLDKEKLEIAKRNIELVKSGPRDEEIKAIEAEIRRYEVELAHAIDDVKNTTLLSPMDGIIVTPYLSQKIGQRLEVGELFAVVDDPHSYVAEVEVPEGDINEVTVGASVKLRSWAEPKTVIVGHTTSIAPIAYEKTLHRSSPGLSEREMLLGQKQLLRDKGKVVRVMVKFDDQSLLKTADMTGYAKIDAEDRLVGLSFFRWLFRLIYVEIWSWIP
ncbi:MAG: HlyD family efflux transporter periplasmic adaptor subunit [Desulfobulbaceae bacterium]|nr:HlyD family efflux transporter periplasmic adaptor subunit [Desulfobulbaceae bacterium]